MMWSHKMKSDNVNVLPPLLKDLKGLGSHSCFCNSAGFKWRTDTELMVL